MCPVQVLVLLGIRSFHAGTESLACRVVGLVPMTYVPAVWRKASTKIIGGDNLRYLEDFVGE